MSSNILETLKTLGQNKHNVGNLNNWRKTSLNQGAVATENMDNFTLVTIGFNPATGERTATRITGDGVKGVLVATPEEYMGDYETISSFFNGVGERVRVVALEQGERFECSNVEFHQGDLNTHPLKNGQVVHYNQANHKFMISNDNRGAGNEHPNYGAAANKFYLVDKDCVSIDGQTVYRFEVQ